MLKEEKRFLRSASFETLPEKLERAAAWEREPLILSSFEKLTDSKSRRYEKISLNRKKNTPNQRRI
jgi:hypothetical protein